MRATFSYDTTPNSKRHSFPLWPSCVSRGDIWRLILSIRLIFLCDTPRRYCIVLVFFHLFRLRFHSNEFSHALLFVLCLLCSTVLIFQITFLCFLFDMLSYILCDTLYIDSNDHLSLVCVFQSDRVTSFRDRVYTVSPSMRYAEIIFSS